MPDRVSGCAARGETCERYIVDEREGRDRDDRRVLRPKFGKPGEHLEAGKHVSGHASAAE
jgi:hypothetical protein